MGHPTLAFAPCGSPTLPQFMKMVDAHSPNTQRVLQSFIPNVFRKANWYRFDDLWFVNNIGHTTEIFAGKAHKDSSVGNVSKHEDTKGLRL